MVTFCPSTTPCSARPLRKASTRCALSLADRALRNPITGLFDGCAFAASGQAAKPATIPINSRRLIADILDWPESHLTGSRNKVESSAVKQTSDLAGGHGWNQAIF